MRKLSWMIVIVMVLGGFLGVTHFTGMWGRGGEDSSAGGEPTSASGWQFEQPGAKDGVMNLKTVADGGLRLADDPREGGHGAGEGTDRAG